MGNVVHKHGPPMTSRQLESRIQRLCEEALGADNQQLQSVCQELQAALREYNQLLRTLVAERFNAPSPVLHYSFRSPDDK